MNENSRFWHGGSKLRRVVFSSRLIPQFLISFGLLTKSFEKVAPSHLLPSFFLLQLPYRAHKRDFKWQELVAPWRRCGGEKSTKLHSALRATSASRMKTTPLKSG